MLTLYKFILIICDSIIIEKRRCTVEYANYPTLGELLRQDIFSNSQVLSGEAALDIPVAGVNLTDTPDYYDWVSPHELLVTNCYAICGDAPALSAFIGHLAEKGVAGVCIKPSRFLGTIPEYIISAAKERKFPLIELPPTIRFADITKAVSDELLRRQTALLHNSIAVNQMLLQTITEGASLEDLAQRIREIAGGSVLLVDSINQRQAYSLSKADSARMAALEHDALCQTLLEEADVYEMRIDGHLFGTVCLCRAKDQPPLQTDILSQILQTIPLEISREHSVRKTESRSFTEFFQHLISDHILDDSWEQSRANAFHLDLSASHALLELHFQSNNSISEYTATFQRTAFFHTLRQSLEQLGIDAHIMDQPDGCLILMGSKEDSIPLDHALARLSSTFETFQTGYPALSLAGGCSRSHAGIPGLSLCRWEAQLALKAACSKNENSFFHFDQLGILRLLYSSNPSREIGRFIRETLKELASPKLSHEKELLETLESYFRNLGNQRRIAQELYIHYNTVAYRLNSIQELTRMNLDNPEHRMQLELALYLRRIHIMDKSASFVNENP